MPPPSDGSAWAQVNLIYLEEDGGAQRGDGAFSNTTYSIPFESFVVRHGRPVGNVKGSGE